MGLHNIIRDTKPKPRSLCPFLCRKKGLQDFILYIIWETRAVVLDVDGYGFIGLMGSDC